MDYRIPPHTCPIIDRVRSFLVDARLALEEIEESTEGLDAYSSAGNALRDLDRAGTELELVRRANAELREAAEGYKAGYEEIQKERDELEERQRKLEGENERIKEELLELGERFSF